MLGIAKDKYSLVSISAVLVKHRPAMLRLGNVCKGGDQRCEGAQRQREVRCRLEPVKIS